MASNCSEALDLRKEPPRNKNPKKGRSTILNSEFQVVWIKQSPSANPEICMHIYITYNYNTHTHIYIICLVIYLFNAPIFSRFPKLVQQEVSFRFPNGKTRPGRNPAATTWSYRVNNMYEYIWQYYVYIYIYIVM